MDFAEDPDHRLLREAVREACARFPDEYWAERDQSHTFPWEFYAEMAKGGWIGVASCEVSYDGLYVDAADRVGEEGRGFTYLLDGLNAERVLVAAEAGFAAADAAMQTHGGFGYASEYHVERYWREARLMRIAPVPQEMVLNYLAEHVLGLPRSY